MPRLKHKSIFQKKYSGVKKQRIEASEHDDKIDAISEVAESDLHNWSLDSTNNEIVPVVDSTNTRCDHEFHEASPFLNLRQNLKTSLRQPWILKEGEDEINIFELYNQPGGRLSVKQCVVINQDFSCKIFVHRREVSKNNDVWTGLPVQICTYEDVNKLLTRLDTFSVCMGNSDEQYKELVPVGAGIRDGFTSEMRAYREGDFSASKGNISYDSTIRSVECQLLVEANRCSHCLVVRRILRKRKQRQEERKLTPPPNYIRSTYKHKDMDRDQLLTKIGQQTNEIKTLLNENDKLRRKCDREIKQSGVSFSADQNQEMKDLMSACREEVEKNAISEVTESDLHNWSLDSTNNEIVPVVDSTNTSRPVDTVRVKSESLQPTNDETEETVENIHFPVEWLSCELRTDIKEESSSTCLPVGLSYELKNQNKRRAC